MYVSVFREASTVDHHVRDPAVEGHPERSQWLGDPDHHQPQVPRHDPVILQGQVSDRLETQQGRGWQLWRASEETSWPWVRKTIMIEYLLLIYVEF